MTKVLSALIVFFTINAHAQEFKNKDLQSLVNAERAFSAMAKEKNTRDAFLFFFADSVVSSVPGQGPRVGTKSLQQQQPNEAWLYWYPVYSDVSASGDFGFNTGPWEFRQKKTDEKPVAFGQFVSMWKKNEQGEWKVVIDIGIAHGLLTAHAITTVTTSSLPLKKSKSKTTLEKFLETEKNFLDDFKAKGISAYANILSKEVRFYRAGNLPFIGLAKSDEALKSFTNFDYMLMGGDISKAGDLAYVYGRTSFDVTKDGVTQKRNGTYMRFWKKEDGKNWKIVLDLVTN